MLRSAFIIIILISIISACSQIATPIPAPTATITPSATITISIEDITAAATYIRTLPPSFTPTFTPSITPTTPFYTATPTATATPIPEGELCASAIVGHAPMSEPIPLDDIEDFIQAWVPNEEDDENIKIILEITNLNTGEIVQNYALNADRVWIFNFTPLNFPDIAEYEWVVTLQDATRTGLCETHGTFDTRLDELPEATQTAIAIGESTAEVIGEATAELTAEVTGEASSETVSEMTPELTPEATLEIIVQDRPFGTPTQNPFRFPPR